MKNIAYFALFLSIFIPVSWVGAESDYRYLDPVGDFVFLDDPKTQILSPIDPIDITSVEALSNGTHILISIETKDKIEVEPIFPEFYRISLVMFADDNIEKDIIYEIYVDHEYGWSVFCALKEPEKIVSGTDEKKILILIRSDISDLGGAPKKVHFLVGTAYENVEPEMFRIVDTAPHQNCIWVPPDSGIPNENNTYFEFDLTQEPFEGNGLNQSSLDQENFVVVSDLKEQMNNLLIPNSTVYVLAILTILGSALLLKNGKISRFSL